MPSTIVFAHERHTLNVRESPEEIVARLKVGPALLHRDSEEEEEIAVFPGHVLYVRPIDPERVPLATFE